MKTFLATLATGVILLSLFRPARDAALRAVSRNDWMSVAQELRGDVISECLFEGTLLIWISLPSIWFFRNSTERTGWKRPPYVCALWECRTALALVMLAAVFVLVFRTKIYADLDAGGVADPLGRGTYGGMKLVWRLSWYTWVLCGFVWWIAANLRIRRLHRLERSGEQLCPTCGYRTTGLASPRCPECGTPIPGALAETTESQPEDGTKR